MATIKDIAKRANVSSATVSYVLNNTRYVSEEKKARVLSAVKELNYVPNAVARGLRVKNSKTIGLIISDISNPFYPDLAKGCEDIAYARGYTISMINTNEQDDRFLNAISQMKEGKLDGLIIACALRKHETILSELIESGYPIVLAHRRIDGLPVNYVVADNSHAANIATRHLLSLGHKKIAFITGIDESSVNLERIEGYRRTLSNEGIEILPEWVVPGYGKLQSYNAMMHLMNLPKDKRPTAILACNDVTALGALDAATDLKIDIPDEIALVSFDDLFIAESRSIQLTTIRIPRYEVGQLATRVIIEQIEGKSRQEPPMKVMLPVKLVVRKTCGAVVEH